MKYEDISDEEKESIGMVVDAAVEFGIKREVAEFYKLELFRLFSETCREQIEFMNARAGVEISRWACPECLREFEEEQQGE